VSIKTYRGSSVHEALAQVKKDLGTEAVILHTRTYKTGGILGLHAKTITEITASAQIHVEPRLKPRRRPAPVKADPRTEIARPPVAAMAESLEPVGVAVAEPPIVPPRFTPKQRHDSPAREVAQMIAAPASGESPGGFENELAAIKRMVGRVLQNSSGSNQGVMPEALNRCYLRLIENEVTTELADEIAGLVRDELSPNELKDASIVQTAVLRRVAQYISVNTNQATIEKPEDGRPLTIALAGPTGVGKTTTIAKLAATYKLRHGKSVGLITCDTYRIAAVDQLRTYANIIGVPLHVALTSHEVERACESLKDCDAILIDTAGRSQRDTGRIDELGHILAAANPHQTHLVLSMATSESVMHQAVERFASIRPDRVIFTKLDEAVNFGALVNIAHKVNAELSFVTNGQEVPDHIEPSNPDRLARLVLNGESV